MKKKKGTHANQKKLKIAKSKWLKEVLTKENKIMNKLNINKY
jgi:hypothetical protein